MLWLCKRYIPACNCHLALANPIQFHAFSVHSLKSFVIPKRLLTILLEGHQYFRFLDFQKKNSETSSLQPVSRPIYFTNSCGICSSNSTHLLLEGASHQGYKKGSNIGNVQELTHLLPTNVWHGKQLVASSQKESRREKKAHHDCGQLGRSQCCPLDLFKLWRAFPFKNLCQCRVHSYRHIL